MPANPVTYESIFAHDFVRDATRARLRRGRIRAVAIGVCTALVLFGLLAIPLFLLIGLAPETPLPQQTWLRFEVLLAGTLRAGLCAVWVAVPLGIATAMFTAHFCAPRLRAWIKPVLEVLEAIPTVILGLVATATVAPWLASHVATVLALIIIVPLTLLAAGMLFGARGRDDGWLPLWLLPLLLATVIVVVAIGARQPTALIAPASPWNALLVGLALGLAAVPIVFSLSEDALFLVPRAHADAAFALGATRWQALTTVVLPAAGSGLLAAALLGLSRCFGETMIVLMASGNTPIGGFDPLTGLRSVSADLALGLPEVAPGSDAYRSLLLAALLLWMLTLCMSVLAEFVRARLRGRLRGDGRLA